MSFESTDCRMPTSEPSTFVTEKPNQKQKPNPRTGWKSTSNSNSKSKRWKKKNLSFHQAMESNSSNVGGSDSEMMMMMMMEKKLRKRVMVVVDESIYSKHAMLWALTHVANKGDMLTLLQIHNNQNPPPPAAANQLVASLATLCKTCKPEVEVEALVIEGPKVATVVSSQVKKLEVSVLVLGQKNTYNNCSLNFLPCCFGGGGGGMSSSNNSNSSRERFVEECINTVECLTIGVRKQSKGIGGYLISTRWRKDFWLLA